MFTLRNICTTKGGHVVHRNLNWEIGAGSIWALVGKSGAGKTTLARIMIGLDQPDSGHVLWNGVECANLTDLWGVQFQANALFNDTTVLGNVMFPLQFREVEYSSNFLEEVALFYISQVGLDLRLLNAYPNQLSGGQRRLVALARALATSPQMLLLDEPTSGLDPATAARYDRMLREIVETNGIKGVVVITHDLDRIRQFDNVAFLENHNLRICNPEEISVGWWESKQRGC